MPALKRRRRNQVGASQAAIEFLTYGMSISGEDTLTPEQLQLTWKKYGSTILEEFKEPGRRPHGFWLYDLRINQPREWCGEIIALRNHGLLSQEEAVLCEHHNSILSPKQSLDLYSTYNTEAGIRTQLYGNYLFSCLVREFEYADDWHRWRGRPELADLYALRARNLRKVLQERAV